MFCSSCSEDVQKRNNVNYLASPSFDTDEYLVQYDAVQKYNFLGTELCETVDALYGVLYSTPDYLRYIDKSNGVNGILCGKPECTHSNYECNGYVMVGARGFSVYDNKIYWVGMIPQEEWYDTGDYLWCMDLDGRNRERLQPIDNEIHKLVSGNMDVQIHRGYLYFSGWSDSVQEARGTRRVYIAVQKMDDSKSSAVILDKTYDADVVDICVRLMANDAYVMVTFQKPLNENTVVRGIEILRWNSKNRECEVIYENACMDYIIQEMWIKNDRQIYLTGKISNNSPGSLWRINPENKELEFCFDFGNTAYGHVYAIEEVVAAIAKIDGKYYVCAKDYQNNLLCEKQVVVSNFVEEQYARMICGGNTENLYYEHILIKDGFVYGYMVEVPILEEKGRIIWESGR